MFDGKIFATIASGNLIYFLRWALKLESMITIALTFSSFHRSVLNGDSDLATSKRQYHLKFLTYYLK